MSSGLAINLPEQTANGMPDAPLNFQRRGVPYFRWVIGTLLFLAAVLNYIDRQALSMLKPTIMADLHLTDADYAHINQVFLTAYIISYLVSGRLVDLWGARIGMAVFVGWWSVSNMLTGLARSAMSLGGFRFSLGLGEAGNWPASTKVVSEWFPARERAFAIGLYTFGGTLGATIAPYIILHLGKHGWQTAFVTTGALGMLWLPLWLIVYRRPGKHPLITSSDLAALRAQEAIASPTDESAVPMSELARWRLALSFKVVWLLLLARLLTDPVWYFYQQWFPSYLFTERAVPQSGLTITWTVFLAADLGTLVGGLVSMLVARRMVGAARSRLYTMLGCALLMLLSPLIASAHTTPLAIALACVIVFAHLAWLVNISALVVDVIPKQLLGTCFGITAAGSALGGLIMNQVIVHFTSNHQYGTWFWLMAFLHPTAWLMLWAFSRSVVSHRR